MDLTTFEYNSKRSEYEKENIAESTTWYEKAQEIGEDNTFDCYVVDLQGVKHNATCKVEECTAEDVYILYYYLEGYKQGDTYYVFTGILTDYEIDGLMQIEIIQ